MNRLEELLLLWEDQTITEIELAELKSLLANPAGRATAAADFFLTGVVLESLRAQQAAKDLPADSELAVPGALRFTPAGRRRIFWLSSAAAAVLIATGVAFWFRTSPTAAGFAQFEQVQGETFLVSKERKLPAQVGQSVLPGQGIATEGAASEAVVQLEDTVRLKLGGDTMVYTTTDSDKPDAGGTRVVLEQGDLLVQVTRSLKKKKMTVQTPLGLAVAETEETALHVSDAAGVLVVRGEVTFFHKATGKAVPVRGGQYVVATADGDLYAAQYFAGNGQVWATFPDAGLDTSSLGFGVAFSPDSKRLAGVGRAVEGSGRLGRVDDAEPPSDFRGERCVCFSPDGQLLASSISGSVLIHEPGTENPPRVLKSMESRARGICLAFAPDGKTLAVGRVGWRDQGGVVELWDVATGTLRHSCRGHAAAVTCLAFSPDSRQLASGSLDKTVVFWDAVGGQERTRTLAPAAVVWSLAFAPDGKTLAIAIGAGDFRDRQPGEVKLLDLATETVRATLRGHIRSVTSVIFTPDGQTLITGSADTTVRFWDLARGREYGMLKGHQAAPGFEALSVALSADGHWLATVSFDRTVKLWKTTWTKHEAGSRISAQAHLDPATLPWSSSLAFLPRP